MFKNTFYRIEEHNAPRTGLEESLESVYGHTNIPVLNEQERSQAPQLVETPFMRELVQMMKTVKQAKSTLDENFEKIREQSANVFIGTTDPVVAEEWLRSTERILNQFDCTTDVY